MAEDVKFFADGDIGDGVEDAAFQNGSVQGELPDFQFGVVGYGIAGGLVGCGGPAMTRLLGPYSTFAGVQGTARDFTGVAGTSVNHVGVYGQVEDIVIRVDSLHAGVLGTALTQPGVVGLSDDAPGVEGSSVNLAGVSGFSSMDAGVVGRSETVSGVLGTSDAQNGVFGICGLTGPSGPQPVPIAGVVGTSDAQHGVIGTSNGGYGVYGFSTNLVGVYGETNNPNAYAGVFNGNVHINGVFTGTDKRAVVPFPDGTQRVLHCMESPEPWFEDFGAARLKRGRTVVKLDADFAKVIKRGDYTVFLTPEGDCRGLYVRKSAASFEVRELMGGKSSVAFSYRIVGRRKDIRGHRRFAKFDMPVPPPAPRARRRAPTRAAFIAELERRARARVTPSMRRSDRKVAAMPPAILIPRRRRPPARQHRAPKMPSR